jgi:hypothetical protein
MAGTLPDIAASFSRRIESDPAGLRMALGLWFVHIGERRHHKYIDAPKQVVLRDTVVEPKLIEQARLITLLETRCQERSSSATRFLIGSTATTVSE